MTQAAQPSKGHLSAGHAPAATIQDMTLFHLYQAWATSNQIFTRLCEGRFNITRREWRILATAVQHTALTSSALAQAASLDAARTSRAIGSLCEKGWLERKRDGRDARTVFVAASQAGRQLYAQIMPVVADLNMLITQDLELEERQALQTVLDKITRRARQMLEIDVIKDRPHRGQPGRRPNATTFP